MTDIALFEPEIPPNTGNIIRLCANTQSTLHIIEPTAFSFEEKSLRRAGLDYRDLTHVQSHANWAAFRTAIGDRRLIAFSTKSNTTYTDIHYQQSDILLFGPETRGLPQSLLQEEHIAQVRIPMQAQSRSINLSNAVAIGLYESLRQQQFAQLLCEQ